MGPFNTYNPTWCEQNKEGNPENYKLSKEYTQQAFTYTSRIFRRMCYLQVTKSA